ncbi:KilA-N domain-containing protein [Asaia astilbis]|uniref:KilA-N domain-containing protein n=1 Tax=Asaia astilbis TaxID=610244 RepID=UPI00046ECB9F|nr:KilA-N domain-containing protein [Asaia astilbis]
MSAAKKLNTTNASSLTILATAIRQDAEGRYCLNDCHKASGGMKKDGPSYWLATDQATAIAAKLTDTENPVSPVSSIKGGANQGTYVAKELVYAYAMWISADFSLTVIRAFDAMVQGVLREDRKIKRPRKPAFDTTYTRLLKIARTLPGFDENQQCLHAARGTFNMTGVNPLEIMGVTALAAPDNDSYLTATEIGQQIGLSAVAVNKLLISEGYQVKVEAASSGSDYQATEKGAPFGRMFDAARKGGKGSQAQLKWCNRIVKHLRPFSRPKEKAS